MMDYIDRQELVEIIAERNRNTCNGTMSCLQMRRMVERVPAADVVPVLHGQWVDAHGDRRVAECSACKELFEVVFDGPSSDELFAWFARFYRYCPNCGARMVGGAGDG